MRVDIISLWLSGEWVVLFTLIKLYIVCVFFVQEQPGTSYVTSMLMIEFPR